MFGLWEFIDSMWFRIHTLNFKESFIILSDILQKIQKTLLPMKIET